MKLGSRQLQWWLHWQATSKVSWISHNVKYIFAIIMWYYSPLARCVEVSWPIAKLFHGSECEATSLFSFQAALPVCLLFIGALIPKTWGCIWTASCDSTTLPQDNAYGGGCSYNVLGLLYSLCLGIIKTLVTCRLSHSYLTGVTAARLQWHLSNMNVIQRIKTYTFRKIKIVSYRQTKEDPATPTTLNKSRRLQLPPHLKLSKEASVTPTPDLVCLPVTCSLSWTPEREIKFIGLFEDRGHRGPYSPYKPFNHNLYIGIIIFPHIDNPMVWQYHIQCTVFKLK